MGRMTKKVATVINGQKSIAFSVASLFAKGEAGGWYDPSDLTSMYEDIAGNASGIPSLVNRPVALLLDKHVPRGPELVRDTGLDDSSVWTFNADNGTTGVAFANGVATIRTAGTSDFADFGVKNLVGNSRLPSVAGTYYEYVLTIDPGMTGTGGVAVVIGSNQFNYTSPGTYRGVIKAGDATGFSVKRGSGTAATFATISYFSVKAAPGNHLYQNTASARPVLRGEHFYGPNLLTNGGFDDGLNGWNYIGVPGAMTVNASGQCVIQHNATTYYNTGPEQQVVGMVAGKLYELEFDLVSQTSSGALALVTLGTTTGTPGGSNFRITPDFIGRLTSAARYTYRFVCPYNAPYLKIISTGSTPSAGFTVDNVTVREVQSLGQEITTSLAVPTQTSIPSTATPSANSVTFTNSSSGSEAVSYTPAIPVKNGALYEVSYQVSSISASSNVRVVLYGDGFFQTGTQRSAPGTYTEQFYVNQAGGSYTQRFNVQCMTAGMSVTVTNLTIREVLPPRAYYLEFDGVDDCMFTPTAMDMSLTDKVTIASSFRKSPRTDVGIPLFELGPDVTANAGTFAIVSPAQNGTVPYRWLISGGGQTASADITATALNGGQLGSLVAQANKTAGTVSIRANGGQNSAAGSNGIVAGSGGNFAANQTLFVGRRNNNAVPSWNGKLFGLVIRGALSTPVEVANLESYFGRKAGVQ